MADKTRYDLIILGAGPAGMTAGVYAARKQLNTLILTGDIGGQTNWSAGVENYLGYVYIPGTELVEKFEAHLRAFDITVEFEKVKIVKKTNGTFHVETESGKDYKANAVIVATGKSPRMLNVTGEKEYLGRGVTYCSTCDGPVFAGMEVMVVGGGNSGLDAVVQLMKICPKVYLVEMQSKLRADEVLQHKANSAGNVEVLTDTLVKEIRGNTFVSNVIVENRINKETRELPVKGVFIEIGLMPNSDAVKDLVALNKYGEIPVDCGAHTTIEGLYAAGDVTDVPEKQIICAAGDGAKAALAAYSYLVRLPAITDWAK